VWLSGVMAAELGGGRSAQAIAALATLTTPVYLSLFTILSMNAFDVLCWALAFWIALRALRGGAPRLWLAFGVVAGLGLLNKVSALFLGAGLVAGLVLGGRRDVFRRPEFWLGGATAALLFLPYIVWQIAHGWPLLEFMENARLYKNVALTPPAFMIAQVLEVAGPLPSLVAAGGLAWLLADSRAHQVRPLGWAYPAIAAMMVAAGGAKPYYLAPAYTVLFAAGGTAIESWSRRWGGGVLRGAVAAALLVSGAAIAPLAKPLLPVDDYVAYAGAIGVAPSTEERHELGRLPQFFADMHGWADLAAAVGRVHAGLSPEERRHACVFAENYGQAGAIDFFGRQHGLPHAISGHNSYFLWGPRGCSGEIVIVIGSNRESLERRFARVDRAGESTCRDCMPYENHKPLWVARMLRMPLSEIWPAVKHFD
jgi:hypothetical protein